MEPKAYKNWIAGVFDRSAESYGTKHSNFFTYFAKNLVKLAALPKSASVLDVATGRGAILKHAAEAVGSQGKVIGIDISPNMITQTSKDLKDYPNITLLCADAENLEFTENSFDYVFCGFGVFFFPNVSRALQEFFRVLKPGGKLLISTWGKDDYCDEIFQDCYNHIEDDTKTLLHHFENPEFIFNILSKSGFTEIETVPDELDYVYPTIDDWFSSLWSHARRAKLEKLTPTQLTKLKEQLNIKLSPHVKSDGLHELLHAYYTHASKPV
jgi:ubiquinone/menaquinone biosynthesis C-methylase UbiE